MAVQIAGKRPEGSTTPTSSNRQRKRVQGEKDFKQKENTREG